MAMKVRVRSIPAPAWNVFCCFAPRTISAWRIARRPRNTVLHNSAAFSDEPTASANPCPFSTPKSHSLRSPVAASSFNELTGSSFRTVIGDTLDPSRVRKVVFCTGKVYYDLAAAREAKRIMRMQHWFASRNFTRSRNRSYWMCSPVTVPVWVSSEFCQEEPRNMRARGASCSADFKGA